MGDLHSGNETESLFVSSLCHWRLWLVYELPDLAIPIRAHMNAAGFDQNHGVNIVVLRRTGLLSLGGHHGDRFFFCWFFFRWLVLTLGGILSLCDAPEQICG